MSAQFAYYVLAAAGGITVGGYLLWRAWRKQHIYDQQQRARQQQANAAPMNGVVIGSPVTQVQAHSVNQPGRVLQPTAAGGFDIGASSQSISKGTMQQPAAYQAQPMPNPAAPWSQPAPGQQQPVASTALFQTPHTDPGVSATITAAPVQPIGPYSAREQVQVGADPYSYNPPSNANANAAPAGPPVYQPSADADAARAPPAY